MKRFSGIRGAPGLAALLLALLGAAGAGPWLGAARGREEVVIDTSPSCAAPAETVAGAVLVPDSDLGAGLREAVRRGASRIRLETDGCDIHGEAPDPPGVPVDVFLRPRRDHVGLLDLRPPARVPAGADFAVDVVVGRTAGPAAGEAEVFVLLTRDGARVGAERHRIRLERGQRRTIRVRDRIDRAGGLVRYRAEVAGPLTHPADARRDAVVRVGDRPLVLAIGPAPTLPREFDVLSREPGEVAALLDDPETRARIDAVLLPGPLPGRPAQERLVDAVLGGAGLLVLGGGGFGGQPLEPVLPLSDTPPSGRAALLLLDFSGSMQERKDELLIAVDRLRQRFAPEDLVACIVFRDAPVLELGWRPASKARLDDLQALQPRGNTVLTGALRRGARLLEEAQGRQRRLYVVSDGKWQDLGNPGLERSLAGLGDVHTAALFVGDDVPPEAEGLFPVSIRAGDDLTADLEKLEQSAPDRHVEGPVQAEAGAPPQWLAGAVPAAGAYRAITRLFVRGAGARVALRSRRQKLPLVGAGRPGGKVVVVAPSPAANPAVAAALPALLRACVRERADRLRAWREGAGLVAEARAPGDNAFFRIDGERVAARPAGPGLWRVRVARVSPGPVPVAFRDAVQLVAPEAAGEFRGLFSCPAIAAAIARDSGGTLFEDEAGAQEPSRDRAVYVTLLTGALLVLVGSVLRRRAA